MTDHNEQFEAPVDPAASDDPSPDSVEDEETVAGRAGFGHNSFSRKQALLSFAAEQYGTPDDTSADGVEDEETVAGLSGLALKAALVSCAAMLGYGSVEDAEAAALRVFPPSGTSAVSASVSITIPVPPSSGPGGPGNTCSQGQGDTGACGGGPGDSAC